MTCPVVARSRPCSRAYTRSRRPASGSHGSATSSSSSSSRSFFTEPNSLSSRVRRVGPEPGHVVEHRRRHLLVAQLAVVRDREAVRLVAHLLQQVQRLGVARDAHRLGLARAGRPLRTAWPGSPRRCPRGRAPRARGPRRRAGPCRRRSSSRFGGYANRLPALRALVALAQVAAEPAGQHLLHRREVVLARPGARILKRR